MEHLEGAGVHSGDSISIYTAPTLTEGTKNIIVDYTQKIAQALSLKGLFNIQFIVASEQVYVIEVNPRSSRTVPFISKVTNIPMVEIATKVMLGASLASMPYGVGLVKEKNFFAVKHPIFSMEKIKNVDIALGPEMKSTGEVMSIEENLSKALLKGMISSSGAYPTVGKAVVSLSDVNKEEGISHVQALIKLGYDVSMTPGTYHFMSEVLEDTTSCKMIQHSDIADYINNEAVELVVNMPKKGKDHSKDGFKMRRLAIEKKVLCLTSLDTFGVFVQTMAKNIQEKDINIYNLCEL
jgi:carbamoyl-phosphate synthase large subunit